jgi:hypothetical protein
MKGRALTVRRLVFCALAGLLVVASQDNAPAAPKDKATPRPEPVAETRLLMEGLNQANFRGLERLLRQRPTDAEAWTFGRGQALLIAETGNLLLLRPPQKRGQAEWLDGAAELRDAAAALARSVANRDFERSRTALGDLANRCNRCHQAFRVTQRIVPFAETADRNTSFPAD